MTAWLRKHPFLALALVWAALLVAVTWIP